MEVRKFSLEMHMKVALFTTTNTHVPKLYKNRIFEAPAWDQELIKGI